MLLHETDEARHEPARRERRQHADREAVVAAARCDGVGGEGDLVQRGAHTLGEHATLRGERHAFAMTREELHAQVVLERTDLPADGAMGEVQLAGRAREALEAGGGLEGP